MSSKSPRSVDPDNEIDYVPVCWFCPPLSLLLVGKMDLLGELLLLLFISSKLAVLGVYSVETLFPAFRYCWWRHRLEIDSPLFM